MILATSTSNEIKKKIKKHFDKINISRSGFITRDGLIQWFINVGYSYSLVEKWCDDFLVGFGERMTSKDCDCKRIYTFRDFENFKDLNCAKHEIEGISMNGFTQFWQALSLFDDETYRDRIFNVFDDNGDGNLDFNELIQLFGDVSFDYDMDEVKKSRVTTTSYIETKVRRMIQEIDKTGDGMISHLEFNQTMTS